MVQTIKTYKNMKTTLKAYKSNMGTNHQKKKKKNRVSTYKYICKPKYRKSKKKKKYIYIYNHQSIVTMTKNIYKLGCPKVCVSVSNSFFFLST